MKPRGVIPFARSVVLSAKFHFKIAFIAVVDNRLHISSRLLTKVDGFPRLRRVTARDLQSDNLGLGRKLGHRPLCSNQAAVNNCNREILQLLPR